MIVCGLYFADCQQRFQGNSEVLLRGPLCSVLTDHISPTASLYSVLRSAGRLLLPGGGAGRLRDAVHAGHGDRLHQRHRPLQQVAWC